MWIYFVLSCFGIAKSAVISWPSQAGLQKLSLKLVSSLSSGGRKFEGRELLPIRVSQDALNLVASHNRANTFRCSCENDVAFLHTRGKACQWP